MSSLPETFLQRLAALFPAPDLEKILVGLATEHSTSFRINTLLAKSDPVLVELRSLGLHPQAIDWLPDTFFVTPAERDVLTRSAACLNGAIYIQNPSSILAPLVLAPSPGEKILDLCAAPGSKTLQMAAMMQNRGWISAVEVVKDRFFRLKANIRRNGAAIVHTYNRDGSKVWRHVPEAFDRVLLDAPCSSEGQFVADKPDSFRCWSLRKIAEMARKQKKLLFSAYHCLKPGGTLLYSTCTMAPEENEAVIATLLDKVSDRLEVLPISGLETIAKPGITSWQGGGYPDDLRRAVRILPDRLMEGFFMCLLRKNE